MLGPIKIMDVEVSRPLEDVKGLDGYRALKVLVRLMGEPIGYVDTPLAGGICQAAALKKLIFDKLSWSFVLHLLRKRLENPLSSKGLPFQDFIKTSQKPERKPLPLLTVAVCTRNRTKDISLCLESLKDLDYPSLDIIVIDNAPSSDETKHLVDSSHSEVRYVCEPRPGLDWARNRAIHEARGEIIAYTDDDAVVDSGWAAALAKVFSENKKVMAVTGLVMPYELETDAQVLFERYGGFGRGFDRRWILVDPEVDPCRWMLWGTGQFGTGANMAFRCSLFKKIGFFDPALDVGTVTNGGGDLEMFFRVLVHGHLMVYEPRALIRHRHRQSYAMLREQITNNGIGLYSYMIRSVRAYPKQRWPMVRLGLFWLWWWHLRRLLISWLHPSLFPRDLIWSELKGVFKSLGRYAKARRRAAEIAAENPSLPQPIRPEETSPCKRSSAFSNAMALRTIDLSQPLFELTDVTSYKYVSFTVTWADRLIGKVDITNQWSSVSAAQLRDAIVEQLGRPIFYHDSKFKVGDAWTESMAAFLQEFMPAVQGGKSQKIEAQKLPDNVPVSIIVGTRDRPGELKLCLTALRSQITERPVEVIVVDNHPESGLTFPVTAQFPEVLCISESRAGSSYARNAGIAHCKGQIIVTVDDDVTMPPDWLEKLLAAFVRSDVMIVTGNILPLQQETRAQKIFELYGGLGRGYEPLEFNGDWFEKFRLYAVPTWCLGGTANAAFRADLFSHPEIGMFKETLGAGIPTGTGEDIYLFYKILKAGYTIFYEAGAYVRHSHRRTMEDLRRQLYCYSKGHVAYHLITLFQHGDLRALIHLLFRMPSWRVKQILKQVRDLFRGVPDRYPLSLVLLEIAGNLAGPWALWRAHRIVKRQGLSSAYISVAQRSSDNRVLEFGDEK